VGSKTTVRFVNRLNFGYQETPQETVLQQVTTQSSLAQFVKLKREAPSSRVFAISPDFHRLVLWELVKPATIGFYGIVFAFQLCSKLSVYGFHRTQDAGIPYHYHDSEEPDEKQRARDDEEWQILMELLGRSEGKLDLRQPCLAVDECESSCKTCAKGSTCSRSQPRIL